MIRTIFSFRTFFYFLYATVLTAVLLYLRFPTEKFIEYCEKRIENLVPDCVCRIDRTVLNFPNAVALTNLQITKVVDGTRSNLRVDRIVVAPSLKNFPWEFNISGEIYDGNYTLKLVVDAAGKDFRLDDVKIKDLNLAAWSSDFNLLERKIAGISKFSGNYQGRYDNPLEGAGKGKISVTAGGVEFLQPVLSLSGIEFEKMAVDITYENKMLRLIEGEVLGKEINAEFNGEIGVIAPLVDSNLLLGGRLTPLEGFFTVHPEERKVVEQLLKRYKTAALPFKIGGSVKRPTFRFSM